MRAKICSQRRRPLAWALTRAGLLALALCSLGGCGLASTSGTGASGATTPVLSGNPKTTSAKASVTGAKLTVKNGIGSLSLQLHNPTAKTLTLVAVTSPAASTAMFMSSGGQMSSQPIKIPPGATLKLNGTTSGSGNDYVMLSGVPASLKPGTTTHVKLTFEVNSSTTSDLTFPVTVS